jgi:hypothetical protein
VPIRLERGTGSSTRSLGIAATRTNVPIHAHPDAAAIGCFPCRLLRHHPAATAFHSRAVTGVARYLERSSTFSDADIRIIGIRAD